MTARRRDKGDGALYFDEARGRWWGVVELDRDGAGRRVRRRVSAPTKAEARRKMRELREARDKGLPVGDGRETVADWLRYWLEHVVPASGRVRSANTLDNYRWAVEGHLIPALGRKTLRGLTAEDVEAMLRERAEAGAARNTLLRLKTVLGRALRDAERRGKVARNVAALVDTPPGGRRKSRTLRPDQAVALLKATKGDRLEALYVTGLMLGLRPGELCGLRWEDVDVEAAVLHVRHARLEHKGRVVGLGDLKTARSRRTLNLPAPVVAALRRHRATQAAERLAAGEAWVDTGLVFTSTIGTAISSANLRRDFDALTRRAGLGHWTPRELRHSAASLLSAAGVPLELVSDVLGHDGTRMTAEVYRHAVKPTVDAAVAPMERLFGTP